MGPMLCFLYLALSQRSNRGPWSSVSTDVSALNDQLYARAKSSMETLCQNCFVRMFTSFARTDGGEGLGSNPPFKVSPSPAEATSCGDVCDCLIQKKVVTVPACLLGFSNTVLVWFCLLQRIGSKTRLTFRIQKVTMFWLKIRIKSKDRST